MSLDDIWAEPIPETPSISEPRNFDSLTSETVKTRSVLFLSDTEDGEDHGSVSRTKGLVTTGNNGAPRMSETAQLDEMFAGLDNDDDDDPFKDVAPAVDIERLKRQADARAATASKSTLPGNAIHDKDKGDKDKKTKRAIPKLDAERLLGHDGFPRLLKEYKNFKITGKGHERADLDRLFQMYHAWTHKMYPKFQFGDTVDRVERLCRSRRLAVNLKVWRDEAHGITPSVGHQVSQDDDAVNFPEQDSENEDLHKSLPGRVSPSTSPRPPTPLTRPGSAASSAPSVNDIDDDMDIDALLREEEEIMREMNATKNGTTGSSSYKPSNPEKDENALWTSPIGDSIAVLDKPIQPGSSRSRAFGDADEEDLWNMIDEIETQPRAPKDATDTRKAEGTMNIELMDTGSSTLPEQPTIGADWADMYE